MLQPLLYAQQLAPQMQAGQCIADGTIHCGGLSLEQGTELRHAVLLAQLPDAAIRPRAPQ
jgi:hypothetical protein